MSIRSNYALRIVGDEDFSPPDESASKLPACYNHGLTIESLIIETDPGFTRWAASTPEQFPYPSGLLLIRDRKWCWPYIVEFHKINQMTVSVDPDGKAQKYYAQKKRVWPWWKSLGWWLKEGWWTYLSFSGRSE